MDGQTSLFGEGGLYSRTDLFEGAHNFPEWTKGRAARLNQCGLFTMGKFTKLCLEVPNRVSHCKIKTSL